MGHFYKFLVVLMLAAGSLPAQVITDKPVGTFYRMPNGDDVSTVTRLLPARELAAKIDAFQKIFITTETTITTITLNSVKIIDNDFIVIPLFISKIRRTATSQFKWVLKPDYFFDDGKLYHRLGD